MGEKAKGRRVVFDQSLNVNRPSTVSDGTGKATTIHEQPNSPKLAKYHKGTALDI